MQFSEVLFLLIWQIMLIATSRASSQVVPIRIMSYNVRYDAQPDNISVQQTIDSLPKSLPKDPSEYYPNTSERPWSTRRIHVSNDILGRSIDIFGGQELLKRQVSDLQDLLGNEWAWIGVGRDDGQQKGEFSVIFYRKQRITLENWDTFWLSDTPFDVSKYPGAGSRRIATVAHLIVDSKKLTLINTHLDDKSQAQRSLGASLILRRAKYEAIKTKQPVVITGDFNSPATDGAYLIMTGNMEPVAINKTFADKYSWTADEERGFESFILKDLLGEAPPQRRSGNYATFTSFAAVGAFKKFERIDYVFGSSNPKLVVEAYHVGENLHDDGIYASDHRPVDVQLQISDSPTLTQQ